MNINKIKIVKDWRLNERHYGSLQGLKQNEMLKSLVKKQVLHWRRGFSIHLLSFKDKK